MSTIRGHQCEVRLLRDGQLVNIINMTKFSSKMDSSFMRSKFVGQSVPKGDLAIDGWSGQASFEVEDDSIEQFIDALVTGNLAGVGVSEYAVIDTETYTDGSQASYLYSDVQWSYSKDVGSYDAKVTKSMDWQASFRQRI